MASEQYTFTFAVVFMLVFSVLISTMPVGLQGAGATAAVFAPVDPSLLTDFADAENYSKDAFSVTGPSYFYSYADLGGRDWIASWDSVTEIFQISALVKLFGFIWLGQVETVDFIAPSGTNHNDLLTFTNINNDSTNGEVKYNLVFSTSGNDAGGLIVYWNTTTYSDPSDAWDNSELYFIHGVGVDSTNAMDIGNLLLSLLFLQLPNIPTVLQIILASPLYASIAFIIWYIVKESLPFWL